MCLFEYFEFLRLIEPDHVNASPVLPDLVGRTQSNMSMPLDTAPNISEGVKRPSDILVYFLEDIQQSPQVF